MIKLALVVSEDGSKDKPKDKAKWETERLTEHSKMNYYDGHRELGY